MSDEILVRVEGVSKKFCRSLKKSLWYGVQDMASELNPFARNAEPPQPPCGHLLPHGGEGQDEGARGMAGQGEVSNSGSQNLLSASNEILRSREREKVAASRMRVVGRKQIYVERIKGEVSKLESCSAGVSPAPFGVAPKERIRQSPGATPADGNLASGSETTARRDGRAPQLRKDEFWAVGG